LNFIVADAKGTIAHAVVGPFPVRRGEDWDGRVPNVWSGPDAWNGFAPPERLPLALNPPVGFVVSANDAGIAASPPLPTQRALTGDFVPAWRARRIRERLGQLSRASADDMARLQQDVRSGSASELQDQLRECAARGAAAELYLGWNGNMDATGPPLLHEAFRAALSARVRERTRLGAAGGNAFAGTRATLGLLRAARDNLWIADWFDDPATQWTETPCDQLRRALDEAWTSVRTCSGDDPGRWSWPAHHPLALRSPFGIGPLAWFFNPRPRPLPGAVDAVDSQAGRLPRNGWNGAPFEIVHGPSYRLVVEFDGRGALRSHGALPGGEDEHPASAHAFDRLDDYARGAAEALIPADPSLATPLHLTPVSQRQ
jgi:penicillin amidase